jgi:hypothetical protein
MSSAKGEGFIEPSNLHWKVEAGSILLGVGSVHDDAADNADIDASNGRVRQDLLDIEADMTHSDTTAAAQNHHSNSTEQHSQDSAQQTATSSAADTQPNGSPVHKGNEGDFEAENGTDAEDAGKWSIMAEGSQRSNQALFVVGTDT